MIINYEKNNYKGASSNRSLLMMEGPKVEDLTIIGSNVNEKDSLVRFPQENQY